MPSKLSSVVFLVSVDNIRVRIRIRIRIRNRTPGRAGLFRFVFPDTREHITAFAGDLTRPCTHYAAGRLMSAHPPTAAEKRTCREVRVGPDSDVSTSPSIKSVRRL